MISCFQRYYDKNLKFSLKILISGHEILSVSLFNHISDLSNKFTIDTFSGCLFEDLIIVFFVISFQVALKYLFLVKNCWLRLTIVFVIFQTEFRYIIKDETLLLTLIIYNPQ